MARVILNQNQTYVSDADDIITNLSSLSDVSVTSAANGDILVYDSGTSNWTNQPNSELTSLNALSDVTIALPANGHLLVYNNATSEWENDGTLIVDIAGQIVYATVPYMGVTQDGSNSEIYVENNSNSAIADDIIGRFSFYGVSDGSNFRNFASIEASMNDLTDTAENGSLNLQVIDAGTLTTKLNIQTSQIRANLQTFAIDNANGTPYLYFNNTNPSIANNDYLGSLVFTDNNFYEYGDISHKLIDNTSGSEASSIIFNNSFNGSVKQSLNIDGSFDEIQFTTNFVSHYYNDSAGPRFYLINSIDPGVSGDTSGVFNFGGYSDTGAYLNYSQIETLMDDTTDGAENAAMLLRTVTNGTMQTKIEIGSSQINVNNAQLVINDKMTVNAAGYDDFTVVRPTTNAYALNIAADKGSALADGDRSNFVGFEVRTTTDWAYPGLIGSEYNSTGNKILLQVYDDGVSSFTRNTILEAGEERVAAYRPFKLAGYASTALPTGSAGDMIAINDNGYKPAYFDGSDWRYVSDDTTV